MCNPPVNCLSLDMRQGMYDAFAAAAQDPSITAIVLHGEGKHFCAGGDLAELGTPAEFTAPRLSADLLPCIERSPKPVIAAIHGGAIGGGFELALACHFRIAVSDALIWLPEIEHGIIPLSGSLRLPRLWGIAPALVMMLKSRRLRAEDFHGSAVFDLLVDVPSSATLDPHTALLPRAVEFARSIGADGRTHTLVRNRPFLEADPGAAFERTLQSFGNTFTPAQTGLLSAVRAGIELGDFDAALARAQQIYDNLSRSRSNLTAS